ncbi:MAG: recombinase family protein [Clostridia bacterium]|nr:recombinase family protein [Clostridia bacterium]
MQKSIRTIQAEPTLPTRQRVAAYARVSSDKDTMLHSLAEQVSQYSRMIQSNNAWEYAGVYADEGITGTKEERPEFQRLLADCRLGKIDMIITKSISRFARNTVTLLKTIRELKLLGIDVFFEENKIHSLQAEGEVLLTILSSYAQAESYSASENTKWRIRKGFEQGELMNWRYMYGYNITKDSIEVDEFEASIVREVFSRVVASDSFRSICRDLNERGIRGLFGGKWSTSYLYQLLGNEKYAGNALLQKTYVNNHIDKKVIRNNGELPRVFVQGSHPPIIDQTTFDAVQVILKQNKAKRAGRKAPEQCEFTGRIICPKCNKAYRHVTSNGSTGWNCSTYMAEGKSKCHGKKIPDTTLRSLITDLLGIPEYDAGVFSELVDSIYPYEGNRLVFTFRDGTVQEATWKERSRAESWTPEMKAQAREDSKRRTKCGK